MNSYTLTFKKQIKYIFILVLFLFASINIILHLYASNKTSNVKFVNTKYSKTKHFKLNNPILKDYIFIGSSKTFYNISTKQFQEKNIEVFNYGIAGAKLTDYPELIYNILPLKPNAVIVSLSLSELVNELELPKYPTINDMLFFYNFDKEIFFKSILNYLKHLVPFFEYSESIYLKIKSIYQKFDHQNMEYNNKKSIYDIQLKKIDCKKFDLKKENDHHITVKCTNGDGIILGNLQGSDVRSKKVDEVNELNHKVLKYLKKIDEVLLGNGINTILIIEPSYNGSYINNLQLQKINLYYNNILNLSSLNIKKNYFADKGHFNINGRLYYTNYLIERLQKYEYK